MPRPTVRPVAPGDRAAWAQLRAALWPDDTDRVGFVEGWYVVPEARRQGVGRALIAAGIEWARGLGCTEFASDAVIDNTVSHAAHQALGFVAVERIVCFKLSDRLTD